MLPLAPINSRFASLTQQATNLTTQVVATGFQVPDSTTSSSTPATELPYTSFVVKAQQRDLAAYQETLNGLLMRPPTEGLSIERLDADTLQLEAMVRGLGVIIGYLDIKEDIQKVLQKSHQKLFDDFDEHRREVRPLTVTDADRQQLSEWYVQFPRLKAALDGLQLTEEDEADIRDLLQSAWQNATDSAIAQGLEPDNQEGKEAIEGWTENLIDHYLPWAIAVFKHIGASQQDILYVLTRLVRNVYDPPFSSDGMLRSVQLMSDNFWSSDKIVELCCQLWRSKKWR